MKKEQRKQKRLEANLFVAFHSPSSGTDIGRGVVTDVSLSGFAVDSEIDFDVSDEVECHIEIPLQLRARVVRCFKEGQLKKYGLLFVGQSLIDKFLLRKLLQGKRQTKKVGL